MFKTVFWEHHPSHLKALLEELYKSSNFSDVTIICDGDLKFKVNKVILALHSGLIRYLLSHYSGEATIIMPEVNHKDIVAIFDLVFMGKSLINIERLDSILSLANQLQIKNFEENMFKIQEYKVSIPSIKMLKKEFLSVKSPNKWFRESDPINRSKEALNNEPRNGMLFVKDHERFQMIKGNPVAPNIDEIGEVNFIKTQQYFDCRLCGKEFKTKNGVQGHHKREHLKRRFVCNECDAEFKLKVHLQNHFRVHHEGIKFGCTHCTATLSTKSCLKVHIETVHGRRKWKCNICFKDYSQKGSLKAHIEAQHYGRKYQCLYCHHSDADASNLNKHVKKLHPEKKKISRSRAGVTVQNLTNL